MSKQHEDLLDKLTVKGQKATITIDLEEFRTLMDKYFALEERVKNFSQELEDAKKPIEKTTKGGKK